MAMEIKRSLDIEESDYIAVFRFIKYTYFACSLRLELITVLSLFAHRCKRVDSVVEPPQPKPEPKPFDLGTSTKQLRQALQSTGDRYGRKTKKMVSQN
ncbi:MAG: hypothetical protein AAF298_26385 [Cyanobacteria bacterium P01_A01_bin.40]